MGLVGKSGAGKSTLIDVFSGQISLSSGQIVLDHKRVRGPEITKHVSLCSQVHSIWPDMKVQASIQLFMKCRGYEKKALRIRRGQIVDPYVRYLIGALELEEVLAKRVKALSGGQKRKLAFLVSLLGSFSHTPVVLMDEAMTGVDVATRRTMWRLLETEVSVRRRSVVVTSHELSEVEQYCDTIGILHRGRMVEMGALRDIRQKWRHRVKITALWATNQSDNDDDNNDEEERFGVWMEKEFPGRTRRMHQDVLVDDHNHVSRANRKNEQESVPSLVKVVTITEVDLSVNPHMNVVSLIKKMMQYKLNDSFLYWSLESLSLDDFLLKNFS